MSDTLRQQAERSLILADARFFRDLALTYDGSTAGAIMLLTLMPHLTAFAVDSAAYLKRWGSTAPSALSPFEQLLQRSRLRLKLLDDSRQSFEETMQRMEHLASLNSRWFMEPHRGVLGPLKRLLQTDLGLYFLEGHVVCTTHVSFLNMGLDEELIAQLSLGTLGPYLRETTTAIGRYTGLLFNLLGGDSSLLLQKPTTSSALTIAFRDVRSERFYDSVAARIAPGQHAISILTTSILSLVNGARFFLPIATGRNHEFIFKARFVTLFHVVSSVRQLLDQNNSHHWLLPAAARQLEEMLDCEILRFVGKHRGLRNTLMHYGIDRHTSSHLSSTLPYFGLVEALGSGVSFEVLAGDTDIGIQRVSDSLRSLLLPDLVPSGILQDKGIRPSG